MMWLMAVFIIRSRYGTGTRLNSASEAIWRPLEVQTQFQEVARPIGKAMEASKIACRSDTNIAFIPRPFCMRFRPNSAVN